MNRAGYTQLRSPLFLAICVITFINRCFLITDDTLENSLHHLTSLYNNAENRTPKTNSHRPTGSSKQLPRYNMDTTKSLCLCAFLAFALAIQIGRCKLTEQERNDTLNFINHLRRNAVPPAADMNGLIWDTRLENLAQRAANSCVFEHNYGGDYSSLGEILYLGSRQNFSEILVFMFLEREQYNYTNGACVTGSGKYPFFSTCGHYLQIVTAGVNKVGCGIQYCSGNYLGVCEFDREWYVPPYQTGEAGTKCGNGYATYFKDGLCYSILVGETPPIPGPFECKLSCLNYGTLMTSPFCSCSCPAGYYGVRCETKNIYFASTIPNDCKAQAVTCKNGGSPTMTGTTCKCVCPANFEGESCQINKVQESNSLAIYFGGEMRYSSYYPIKMSIWNDTLLKESTRTHLTDAINSYCNANFSTCCPSSTASSLPATIQHFATCEDFHVADSYPIQAIDGSMRVDVYYTMQPSVDNVCNGKTNSYVSKAIIKSAWTTAMKNINAAISAIGLKAIKAD
ncbi:hypothetical protein BOX15_Mlig000644g6 [Macrostomum lignano]|uniref:EGF-like domain-containing protein n=1 Tax=Macrostomum lignano TaxID=282301 RepID=A0A267FXP2_9PLAT|nr:hypothetical protein BOX15_Mlig000644g6 [Macrostomum lignano]